MNATASRKGATRAADIPPDVLEALSRGELQSATLAEALALDQARLLLTVFPSLSPRAQEAAKAACQLGILKRTAGIGAALLDDLGAPGIDLCRAHGSDTVRSWACRRYAPIRPPMSKTRSPTGLTMRPRTNPPGYVVSARNGCKASRLMPHAASANALYAI